MGRKARGNPNWGRKTLHTEPVGNVSDGQTAFEIQVATLQLGCEQEVKLSAGLKEWVRRNRNRRYVPEWLLDFWGMEVELGSRNHGFGL